MKCELGVRKGCRETLQVGSQVASENCLGTGFLAIITMAIGLAA